MTLSTPSTRYTYTDRNLLENPEYYFYSVFGGAPFLAGYLMLRQQQRDILRLSLERRLAPGLGPASEKCPRCLGSLFTSPGWIAADVSHIVTSVWASGIPSDRSPEFRALPDFGLLSVVDTTQTLMTLLDHVLASHGPLDRITERWVSEFLKRFEVTKRLYTTYGVGMRRASDTWTDERCYVLLSCVLLAAYMRTARLKFLNGAIKLNDVVCSLEIGALAPEDLVLRITCIDQEISCVRNLALRHGVAL